MEIVIIMITGFVLYLIEGEAYRRIWQQGLDANIRLSSDTAFKGDKCALEITLLNRKLIPLPWLWVKLHISLALKFESAEKTKADYVYYNALFCIMGWQKIKRTLPFTASKRGYYPLRSFDVVGTSILFNGKHSKNYNTGCALTVYPELIDISQLEGILSRLDGLIESRGFINPDPFEFSGIREYMPTDNLRDINFKASVHTGELMSNTHNPTIRGKVSIILCMKLLKQRYEEERFEYAISLAATLAEYYISQGFSVALYSNGTDGAAGDTVYIEEGIGDSRLQEIYESLARISYEKTEDTDILMPVSYSNAAAVFISPTVDLDIARLYENVCEKYAETKWLFPVMEFDMALSTPPAESAELISVPVRNAG